jgi:hypothetical protein
MLPIADMRHVVAAIDDRPRHSGGGCTLSKQTPRSPAAASPMGQKRTHGHAAGTPGFGLIRVTMQIEYRPVRGEPQTVLPTPQKNGPGPGTMPLTFLRQA